MADERIHVLRDILLELHNGASPESVQERFDATFAGVSAIEISLMEHELMNSDSGVTFEDVMELCDVHANLFKNAIKGVEVSDTEHPGHPVRVFKEENLALRAALIRIRRLLDTYESMEDEEMLAEMRKGLVRQMGLVGQFDIHYQRKEELFFPIMERYGHDSPPKVMWGVDDQIRELFQTALTIAKSLPEVSISSVKEAFEAFATEFESMIFKEESILLMILLESFTQDDWLQIAEEPVQLDTAEGQVQQVIDTPEGHFTITFTPKEKEAVLDRHSQQAFGNGYLSVEQANLILNHLPMEITFVNKDDIFQYYNDNTPADEMIFKRTPSQVGRNVELCHPPKYLDKVKTIMKGLREGTKDKYEMWFKSESRGKFVHITYAAVHDEDGEFQGVLEYVQDIQPYREIDTDYFRGLE
ncbi:TPA: DUF438 domain-containing protein [Streptococcus pneumoniae]